MILFGFPNAGKTTLGKKLAARWGLPFFDTDQLLERRFYPLSVRSLYKIVGEEAFRKLEETVISELKGGIIAVGGGTILYPKAASLLAKLGPLVYVKVGKETLKERTLRDLPSYLDPNDPEGAFERMYQERLPQYEAIIAYTFDVETTHEDEIFLEIGS
ncbi:MAG: shikimate kinase [Verrucomicrobia bacterium]|nr:shikimate kinase [Verrucomicrobiota bacterium]